MKFIHMADVHLGIIPDKNRKWSQDRSQEIFETFRRTVLSAKEENADLLLIAGDLFHGQPLLRMLREVNYLFEKISPVQVVIIAGNHDHIKDNSFYRTFRWSDNVFFLKDCKVKRLELKALNTDIYGMSYHTNEIKNSLYDNIIPEDHDRINILLGHGGDLTHIPIDESVFYKNGFDYSAFGHIHKSRILPLQHFAFSGSLEPTDRNDFGQKGYIIGNIDPNTRKLQLEFRPCAKRQYILIKINCNSSVTNAALTEKISEKINESGIENIYRIVLTGIRHESATFDLENSLRDFNILEVTDETHVEYDFEKLADENEGTIISQVIRKLKGVDDTAMFYAVNALLRTKR